MTTITEHALEKLRKLERALAADMAQRRGLGDHLRGLYETQVEQRHSCRITDVEWLRTPPMQYVAARDRQELIDAGADWPMVMALLDTHDQIADAQARMAGLDKRVAAMSPLVKACREYAGLGGVRMPIKFEA